MSPLFSGRVAIMPSRTAEAIPHISAINPITVRFSEIVPCGMPAL